MDYKALIEGLMMGYAIWIVTGLVLNQNWLTTEKVASLVIGLFWLLFHIYTIISWGSVPNIFDIVWAGATASFAWLNISTLIKSFKGNA